MNKEFPFIGGSYTSRSKDLNSQVCQNLYVETDQTGAKNIISLQGCPGMKEKVATGYAKEVRGMAVFNNNLFAVIGDTVYRILPDLSYSSIGTLNTDSGFVDFTNDGIYLGIYDSLNGWYCDGTTITQITDTDFQTPSGATYQDGYQIISRKDTDQFFISASDDITSWDATDFATAEGDGDILVKPVSVQRQLWLIGTETTEIWYNSGESFPFTRNPGGFIRIGCNAKRSITSFEDDLMFLDNNNRVVRKFGLQLEPVSTYQIDYLISTFSAVSDAVGFIYQQEGHTFYELSFPTADKTICYDLTTGLWHTRASGVKDKRSRANCVVRFQNMILVGDYENGKIYEYDFDTYTDNGDPKRAIRACQFINNNNDLIFVNALILDMETGVANASVTAPVATLEISRDGGHTWSPPRERSIGAIGQYGKRVRWNRLGKFRTGAFRITISDAVKRNINKAYLDFTPGND